MSSPSKIAELPFSEASKLYTWWFPGAPVKVQLTLDVVESLQAELRDAERASKQGVLLGKISGQITKVLGFKPATGESPSIAELAATGTFSGGLQPVGYYKTTRDEALRLSENDVALAEAAFRNPHHVFLIIQPTSFGPANATFFFRDEGRLAAEFPFLEFPLDAGLLATAEQERLQSSRKKPVVDPEPVPAPAAPVQAVRQERRVGPKPILWGGIAVLAIAVPVAVVVAWIFPSRAPRSAPPEVSINKTAAPLPRLGLQAQRQDGDLTLTWNQEADTIRSATSGVLEVLDGGNKRQINLDSAQVQRGRILYAPTGDQVQMQLTVTAPQGTVSESVLVLLPKTGAPQVQLVARKQIAAPPARGPAGASQPSSQPSSPPAQTAAVPEPETPVSLEGTPDVKVALPLTAMSRGAAGVAAGAPPPVIARAQQRTIPQLPPAPAPGAPRQQPAANLPVQLPPGPQPIKAPVNTSAAVQQSNSAVQYYPPEVEKPAALRFPEVLKPLLSKPKTVEVRVSIDKTGKVVKAEALPSDALPLMIAPAVRAAMEYKFKPARRGNEPIPSETTLQFVFKPRQ